MACWVRQSVEWLEERLAQDSVKVGNASHVCRIVADSDLSDERKLQFFDWMRSTKPIEHNKG